MLALRTGTGTLLWLGYVNLLNTHSSLQVPYPGHYGTVRGAIHRQLNLDSKRSQNPSRHTINSKFHLKCTHASSLSSHATTSQSSTYAIRVYEPMQLPPQVPCTGTSPKHGDPHKDRPPQRFSRTLCTMIRSFKGIKTRKLRYRRFRSNVIPQSRSTPLQGN
ncbi:hypothetical protein HDV62DRAFT_361849 [Trichoderma sp. SZMC 28011]